MIPRAREVIAASYDASRWTPLNCGDDKRAALAQTLTPSLQGVAGL